MRLRRSPELSASSLVIQIALVIAVFCPPASSQASASRPTQAEQGRTGDPDLYQQVLDRVFRDSPERLHDEIFVLTIRRRVYSKPEVQLRLIQRREHPGTLEYVAAEGNIESVVSKISRRGGVPLDEIARSIKLTKHTLPVENSILSGWNEGFLRSIGGLTSAMRERILSYSRTGAVEVTLDDELIEVTYAQGLSTLSFQAPISECGDVFTSWVDGVTTQVQEIVKGSKGP